MRVSREAAAESKARILAAASKMVRERGVEATSVADVMHAAGMTHGGFYKHFDSKDDLIAAAIRYAFDDVAERFDRRERQDGRAAAIDAYVEEYLSGGHMAQPGRGCPVASVGADAGRNTKVLAPEFAAGAEMLIERLGGSPGKPGSSSARARAIRRLARLVGAVLIARAVGSGPLRDEIIAACSEPQ